jgi:CDP-diacylglycerol--glycerol-3-phosphate 3-phosphatidyltransferase
MTIYDLKPAFQSLLRPFAGSLARLGVTANQVTLAALVLSLILGALLAWGRVGPSCWLALPVWLFVRMALNAIDGILAREHNMKTPLGAILNELGDVLSDTALYLPFATIPGVGWGWVTAAVVLAGLSEMTGVLGLVIGAGRRYDGPMGKSDRAFAFGLMALLLGLGVPAGKWILGAIGLINLMLVVTVWNRARRALREVKK